MFSVIIPTCNRPDLLAECLGHLAPGRQTAEHRHYEVIVTDDGSVPTAETLLRERFPWARWTAGPRQGPAANRNHGATCANGEWLVFTDDDCLPESGWIEAYATATALTPTAKVLEGKTLACGPRESIDTEAPINALGGCLWSCNFAVRRHLFLEMGGFDTGFPGPAMEDVEFRTRLRDAGVTLTFIEDALVYHPWRKRKGLRFLHSYARSVDYFVSKHPKEAGFFSFTMQLRILATGLIRMISQGFQKCGGRGVERGIILEIYTFILLTWFSFKRRSRKPTP